jgi:hypothetical protein
MLEKLTVGGVLFAGGVGGVGVVGGVEPPLQFVWALDKFWALDAE